MAQIIDLAKKVLLVIVLMLLVLITIVLNVLYAAPVQHQSLATTTWVQKTYDCDGITVNISRNGDAPLTMDVGTEVGLWIEVPTDEPSDLMFFYNIATSKVAVISAPLIGGVQTMVLQTYRDVDFYRAHKNQLNLRCKRATHSIQH